MTTQSQTGEALEPTPAFNESVAHQKCDVLVVASEDIWPPRQGGQVRVAGIVGALSQNFRVAVAVPNASADERPVPVYSLAVATKRSSSMRGFVSSRPRIGRVGLGAFAHARLHDAVTDLQPRAVLFTHSYLAAMSPSLGVPIVVDFANIERERLKSFRSRGRLRNRLSATLEAAKASRWEPRVALDADFCLALTQRDRATLEDWGATATYVPNGVVTSREATNSPESGHVLFLASADYAPNRDAGHWLIFSVWPLVRQAMPSARLVVAGRRSDDVFRDAIGIPSIEVLGEVPDVAPLFEGAALVAAPITSGGGQQLKVIEALSFLRVVVASPFSARSVPNGLESLCRTASGADEYAKALVELLTEPSDRWSREDLARDAVARMPTWLAATKPLTDWLRKLS